MLKSLEEMAVTKVVQDQFTSFFFAPTPRPAQVSAVRDQWQKRFEVLQHRVAEMTHDGQLFNTPSVVIGGTSGKGSTAQLLATVLAYSGKRVGVFTSPHLQSLGERFVVLNGDTHHQELLWPFLKEKSLELKRRYSDLSYFEALFILAGQWFSQCACDWVVWEAGCGGRWDATNALVRKQLVIMTNVELDHQDLLGHTRQDIAIEKAPLLSHSDTCVIGEPDPDIHSILVEQQRYWKSRHLTETYPELEVTLDEMGCLSLSDHQRETRVTTGLYGEGQRNNVRLVAIAAKYFQTSCADFCSALDQVKIEGRIEQLQSQPTVVIDIAHNPHKLGNLLQTIQRWSARRRVALVAFSEGKDVMTMLTMLSQSVDEIWVSVYQDGQGRRGCSLDQLRGWCGQLGILSRVQFVPTVVDAVESIRQQLSAEDLWVITGSTFLYAEAKACWR